MRSSKRSVNWGMIIFLVIFLIVPLIVVLKPHRTADGEWHQVSRLYLICRTMLIAYGFGFVAAAASGGMGDRDIIVFGPIPVPVILIPFICMGIALIGGFKQTPGEYLIGDGIRLSAEDNIVILSEYNFPDEDSIVIPEEIKGKKITHIGDKSFAGSHYSKVIIPEGIKDIGREAFKGAALSTLIIRGNGEGTLIIDIEAFSNCSNLKIVTVNREKTYIKASAFTNCSSLTQVFGKGYISLSGKGFLDDSALQTVFVDGTLSLGLSYDDFKGCSALDSVAAAKNIENNTFHDLEHVNDHITLYQRYLNEYDGPRSWTDDDGTVYP